MEKNKIGILLCAYGEASYVESCLENWAKLKEKYNLVIAGTHSIFKEYIEMGQIDNDIETLNKLIEQKNKGIIDYLWINNNYTSAANPINPTEAEARNYPLQWLLKQEVEWIYLLDLDERYTEKDIESIINYLNHEDNQFYGWLSTPMKNYVFDGTVWIDGFCPPRAFRTKLGSCKLNSIYWDNDIDYINGLGQKIDYKLLPNKSIPKNKVNKGIKHMTWLHSNGKSKYEYQVRHFGHCGYKWNYETNQLEFNKEFHAKHNIPIPELQKDEQKI